MVLLGVMIQLIICALLAVVIALPVSVIVCWRSKKNKKQNKKVRFVVVREFSGDKTMREAFEQLIERQTCEHFEEWLEHREMAQKAA